MPAPSMRDTAARRYLVGQIPLPPEVAAKRSRPYFFGEDVSIPDGTSKRLDVQIHDDAHHLVQGIQLLSSLRTDQMDKVEVQYQDTTSQQTWSNKPVSMRDAAGIGNAPKYFKEPNILRPSSTFSITITNNTGALAHFYFSLVGKKIFDVSAQDELVLVRRLAYQYVLDVPSLLAAENGRIETVQIFNESDFMVKRLLSSELHDSIIEATAGAESAEVLLNLRDTSLDRNLFNKKLAGRLMFGAIQSKNVKLVDDNGVSGGDNHDGFTHGVGFTIPEPWFVPRNGKIEAEFVNKAASAQSDFRLVFDGIRLFDGV